QSSITGLPSSRTVGPCGPLTMRRRRLRPSCSSSARRSAMSLIVACLAHGDAVGRPVGARRSIALGAVAKLRRGIQQPHLQIDRLAAVAIPQMLVEDLGALAGEPAR